MIVNKTDLQLEIQKLAGIAKTLNEIYPASILYLLTAVMSLGEHETKELALLCQNFAEVLMVQLKNIDPNQDPLNILKN
jgi:hypothetical protein